ncbi:uncharacterized protein F5147DRAFT_731686, partial [Suillus discolor]
SIGLYSLLTKFTVLVLCVPTTSMHLARQCSVKCCLTASSFNLLKPQPWHCQKPRVGWVKHHSHHDKFSKTSSQSLY